MIHQHQITAVNPLTTSAKIPLGRMTAHEALSDLINLVTNYPFVLSADGTLLITQQENDILFGGVSAE